MAGLGSPQVVNIEDLRRLAQRRLPRAVFDYMDGGAADEVTLRENCRAFQEVVLRPRQAVANEKCDLRTRVVGQEISFPAILAPVGYSRLMHPGGEVAAARAAGETGTGFVLSTISGHRMEKVKEASSKPVWYQLYVVGGRAAAEAAIERARVAGFSALVVTIDTPVAGLRERDVRNGVKELMGSSLLAKIPFLPNLLAHPGWLAAFLVDGGVPKLENIVTANGEAMPMTDVAAALSRAVVTWEDLRWLRKAWRAPIIVKGVLTGDDARRTIDEGAEGLVVSNHGGRQLDGVAGNCRGCERASGSINGWRRPPRLRHCESDLHGSASRAGGARIRVWSRRRWASRSEASARDIAHGNGANDEVAGLRLSGGTEFVAGRGAGRTAGQRARVNCRAYCTASYAVSRCTRSEAHKIVFKQRFRAIRYFRF
jgi:L-lactate dehydrogenase (cytochrome)